MTYIEESLSPGEKILKITQYHWMYLVSGIISALFFMGIALGILFLAIIYHYYDIVKLPPWNIGSAASELAMSDYMRAFWHTNIIARVAAFVLILMGFIQVLAMMLVRATTEIGVTNRRIVLKRGIISRKVEEMRVDFIEGADVNQTVWGRVFGYGQIKSYGTGTESIFFPKYTADAIAFRRAIQAARTMNMPGYGPQAQTTAAGMQVDPVYDPAQTQQQQMPPPPINAIR
jgi:uncharacterized membrane protein YdbT with pleckstrin-like domain